MLELVDTTMLTLEVNEKEQAPMGQRIRAVGMCFFKKGDLEKGNNYKLRRNSILKIFVLLYIKNLHGPAKKSVATVLPAELTQLPTSATKIS